MQSLRDRSAASRCLLANGAARFGGLELRRCCSMAAPPTRRFSINQPCADCGETTSRDAAIAAGKCLRCFRSRFGQDSWAKPQVQRSRERFFRPSGALGTMRRLRHALFLRAYRRSSWDNVRYSRSGVTTTDLHQRLLPMYDWIVNTVALRPSFDGTGATMLASMRADEAPTGSASVAPSQG
jgi:hypothetical protein